MKRGIFALACTATLLLASCKDKPADTVTEETTVEETAPQPADITEKAMLFTGNGRQGRVCQRQNHSRQHHLSDGT